MNINELRINNLISHRGLICTVEIINGELNEIYFLGEDFYHSDKPENLEGVPLTEEWILKFEKVSWINKDILGIFYWFNGEKKYILFVHSFQNTYFELTGKELTSTKAN